MRQPLLLLTILFSTLILQTQTTLAAPGDTTLVQTFTYGSPQEGTFLFPDSSHSWEKILMYYRLKCNPAQNPACGEWDYLTYTYLYDHTGTMDSTLMYQPSLVLPGQTPDSLAIMLQTSHQYMSSPQYQSAYGDSSNYQVFSTGGTTSSMTVQGDDGDGRSIFMWQASELLSAGMAAGDIHGIRLVSESPNAHIDKLKISIGTTTQSSLLPFYTQPVFPTMQDVVERDVDIDSAGAVSLVFHQPFYWDGTSSLLMELAFISIQDSLKLTTGQAGFTCNLTALRPQHYLHFEPYNYAEADDIDALDSATAFTFEAWIRADDFRNWGNIFMKSLANNARIGMQLGGDGSVQSNTLYCLVGNGSNSYGASSAIIQKNTWYHVAMVYDGSGANNAQRLKLYLNGDLQTLNFNGSIPAFTANTTAAVTLSSPSNNSWDGDMDEVRIWSVARSQNEIREIMYDIVWPSNPAASDLLAYYRMNEGSGLQLSDASPNQHTARLSFPTWRSFEGQAFKEFIHSQDRPSVEFEQGNMLVHTDTIMQLDSTAIDPFYVILYNDPLHATTATDTLKAWPLAYTYLFDSNGVAIDSSLIPADTILYSTSHPYYGAPFEVIERYELGRFITPYGIGLDMGSGFTWVYDVSDFAPLLQDSVHLKAGNWQELLDMKFVMIEGTPPRKVNKIEKLWNGNYNLSSFDTQVPPLQKELDPASSMYNVKITTTGHQFSNATNCAEFCYKIHSVDVDGNTRYSWQIMEECADNPLYPQGGTWVFDRAGWCPGAKATTHDIDITPWVTPGDTAEIDYNSQYDPYGNYVVESYLVSYSDPNFIRDASIEEIIAPSTMKFHGRFNPICGKPMIRIRNNGTENLTSLTFDYGLCGATPATFQWSGSLEFMEEAIVELPPVELFGYDASQEPCFSVEISAPNNLTDENPYNNSSSSSFELPPDFENPFIFRFRANHAPQESAWWIEDIDGNTLYQNGVLQANTYKDDTISLNKGCYQLNITDAGGNGLEFWYNMPPYGNGTAGFARVKSTLGGYYLYSFEPDFGNFTGTAFTIGFPVGIEEEEFQGSVEVFPNPAVESANLFVSFSQPQDVDVKLYDLSGRVLWRHEDLKVSNRLYTIPIASFSPGAYVIHVETGEGRFVRKLIVGRR